MQKQAAIQFLERLFKEVWSQPNPAKIDEFYHPQVTGYFGVQPITLADIKNRATFTQHIFANIQTEILDIVAEDNKIAVRLKQTAVRKDGVSNGADHHMAIYHLRDNKIVQLFFLTDKPFDYKEKI